MVEGKPARPGEQVGHSAPPRIGRVRSRRRLRQLGRQREVGNADGLERARAKLEYSPLAAAFCADEFTVAELRHVYEVVWGTELDPRNFHRKVTGSPGFLAPTGRTTTRNGGRPAQLYRRGKATLLNPPISR